MPDRTAETTPLMVALLVSAWIEISLPKRPRSTAKVALLVSAWIEIGVTVWFRVLPGSRTPCECVD